MRIKTAVIGCGAMTRMFHIPSILQHPVFELVTLVDPCLEAARQLNKEYGISALVRSDVRDLPPTDAAIVAVPPHLHAETCTALLRRGIHVLCEKPMATGVVEGEGMLNAAQEGKSVLLIGMQKHYCPNTKLLKNILNDGMLGKIEGFKLISAIRSQWNTGNINRFNPEYSKGGILFEHGVHWIHRIVYWFGYPKRIQYADDRIDGVEVNAFIESEFNAYDQNIPGSMYFSWDHNLKNQITIFAENGVAEVLENENHPVFLKKEINGNKYIMEIRNQNDKGKDDLFARQLDYFSECIGKKIYVPEPTVFALETVRFVEQCYQNRLGVRQPWVYHGIDGNRNTKGSWPTGCTSMERGTSP